MTGHFNGSALEARVREETQLATQQVLERHLAELEEQARELAETEARRTYEAELKRRDEDEARFRARLGFVSGHAPFLLVVAVQLAGLTSTGDSA